MRASGPFLFISRNTSVFYYFFNGRHFLQLNFKANVQTIVILFHENDGVVYTQTIVSIHSVPVLQANVRSKK